MKQFVREMNSIRKQGRNRWCRYVLGDIYGNVLDALFWQ